MVKFPSLLVFWVGMSQGSRGRPQKDFYITLHLVRNMTQGGDIFLIS